MYFLVLLHEPPRRPNASVDHEPFVDALTRRNLILLGGPFASPPAPGVWAAYVLRCESEEDARAIVATDPLVTTGLAVPSLVGWDLEAVNPAAIDPELAVTPGDC